MFGHAYQPLPGDPNSGADELTTFSMTAQNNGNVVVDMQAVGVGIGPRSFGGGSRPQRSALRRSRALLKGHGTRCGLTLASLVSPCVSQLTFGRGRQTKRTCVRSWTWGFRRIK